MPVETGEPGGRRLRAGARTERSFRRARQRRGPTRWLGDLGQSARRSAKMACTSSRAGWYDKRAPAPLSRQRPHDHTMWDAGGAGDEWQPEGGVQGSMSVTSRTAASSPVTQTAFSPTGAISTGKRPKGRAGLPRGRGRLSLQTACTTRAGGKRRPRAGSQRRQRAPLPGQHATAKAFQRRGAKGSRSEKGARKGGKEHAREGA